MSPILVGCPRIAPCVAVLHAAETPDRGHTSPIPHPEALEAQMSSLTLAEAPAVLERHLLLAAREIPGLLECEFTTIQPWRTSTDLHLRDDVAIKLLAGRVVRVDHRDEDAVTHLIVRAGPVSIVFLVEDFEVPESVSHVRITRDFNLEFVVDPEIPTRPSMAMALDWAMLDLVSRTVDPADDDRLQVLRDAMYGKQPALDTLRERFEAASEHADDVMKEIVAAVEKGL